MTPDKILEAMEGALDWIHSPRGYAKNDLRAAIGAYKRQKSATVDKDRILELAKECGLTTGYIPSNEYQKFYQLAHQDGQRAMRERAAKAVRTCGTWASDRAIKSLEITNDLT